ncbi:hypothetical protein OS493_035419 [Desmophyllum pertusum]|uniref:Uncharacterized protein n=1 Tax=Desmophyllum pertusum TaxID=174260 RepID=A0A9W9ZLT4_9CNID|nr:hypothetical protein OS493_035419 [Desmophyllum pertusum]
MHKSTNESCRRTFHWLNNEHALICVVRMKKYIIDVFSYVQPGHHGYNESRIKQVLLYITREVESSRKAFLQEEQTRLGMIKVYSDRFCWSNAQAGMLIAQLEMGDFQAVKQVERRKIDQMKLPEKITYTLPPSNATSMKMTTRLLNESQETLLETEQLDVKLYLLPQRETKAGVEHEHSTN